MTQLAPKTISQHKLRRYKELEALVKEFEALKKEIKELANDGLPCQPGPFSCHVKTTITTSIPWKAEFILVAGEDAAEEVAAKHKGNSQRQTLVVTDRDNPTG